MCERSCSQGKSTSLCCVYKETIAAPGRSILASDPKVVRNHTAILTGNYHRENVGKLFSRGDVAVLVHPCSGNNIQMCLALSKVLKSEWLFLVCFVFFCIVLWHEKLGNTSDDSTSSSETQNHRKQKKHFQNFRVLLTTKPNRRGCGWCHFPRFVRTVQGQCFERKGCWTYLWLELRPPWRRTG